MSLESISLNQTAQGRPQLNSDLASSKSSISEAGSEIGSRLVQNLPQARSGEKQLQGKPLSRLYNLLSNLSFRFKSFFSPGTLSSGQNLPFPFKLSYQVQTFDNTEEATHSVHPAFEVPRSALLANIASTRQGLVQIRSDSEECLGSSIASCLNTPEFDQGIPLNDEQKIVGCYVQKETPETTHWCLQIYDSSEEETVEVPVTVINLKDTSTLNLEEKMANIKSAMDEHLQAIHPAYQDSVKQPVVMCDTQPRMANLVVAQEELLSRLYSGQCKSIRHMDSQIDEVLHLISPERPLLVSKEEKLAFSSNVLEAYENNSITRLMGKDMALPHEIRASRRHFPVPGFPITAVPLGVVQVPVKATVMAKPETPRTQPAQIPERTIATPSPVDVSPPTLSGKKPLTKPALLLSPVAYKEPLKQMLCTVNSMNTFFQTEVVTPEKMARKLIHGMRSTGLDLSDIHGLGHPKVVAAMERGETIVVSKADFLGPTPDQIPEEDLLHNNSPAEQWQNLINVSAPLGPRKDWVDNADELNGIEYLTITPSDWLSAYSGVGIDLLEGTINSILQTGGEDSTWDHLPEAVTSRQLITDKFSTRDYKIGQLVAQVKDNVPIYMAVNKEFPMILLTGSGKNEGNHFYTIAYNKPTDSWISLNSDATRKKGVQACEVFCKHADLEDALLNRGIHAVLIPQLF